MLLVRRFRAMTTTWPEGKKKENLLSQRASSSVCRSSQMSPLDRRYFLKEEINKLEGDASPSACSDCRHMEISLTPNQAV